jgi:diguanylate cyclase (GGDEF)-like protein/PAS domain S-box-containing protein
MAGLKERLMQTDALRRAIYNSVNFAYVASDAASLIQIFNVGAEHMLGYSAAEVVEKLFPGEMADPQDLIDSAKYLSDEFGVPIAPGFEALVYKASRGIEDIYELTACAKEVSETAVSCNASVFYDYKGALQGIFTAARDISERFKADESIEAARVFNIVQEGIMITDAVGAIINVNEACTHITGYSRDEVLGQNLPILNAGMQTQAFHKDRFQTLATHGHWSGELWDRHKNGDVIALLENIVAVRDTAGHVKQYVSMFADVPRLKADQAQLRHLAQFDGLTNLPNRVLLADRLVLAMAQLKRHPGQLLAVVFVDLDDFKSVNDNHGHQVGDQLLIALAERMQKTLRIGDTLSRIGGDEFVAVMLELTDVADSVPTLTRLLTAGSNPVPLGDLTVQLTASLGVAFYPQAEAVDAEQLIRQADQAMYLAKQSSKNQHHIYDAVQDRSVRDHFENLKQIRQALSQNEFVLYYQPKVSMRTGLLIGAEALIRWQHPERGLLLPGAFLPAIDDHPLAIDIGEWVIHKALQQLSHWHELGLKTQISVNVGARQLKQDNFVDRLREILAAYLSVQPGDLQIEILDTCAFDSLGRVSNVIEACRPFGVTFALDDFGTGLSSLTYLKRLPVAMLKIDQSFVANMLDDAYDLAILTSVVVLATTFRRQLIAEGVESVGHGKMLLPLGCDLAQGNGIAPAMPAAGFPGWAAAWRPFAAWTGLSTVDNQALPLLFARAEHVARVAALEQVLQGQLKDMPHLNHQPCHFGEWLQAHDKARPEAQRALEKIKPLHKQRHALEQSLMDIQAQGNGPEALA